jgi:hypothetical protein
MKRDPRQSAVVHHRCAQILRDMGYDAIKFEYEIGNGLGRADIIDSFDKIAAREGKSFSELVVVVIEDYIKKHGDGNPSYSLQQWQAQPEFHATPAFGRVRMDWMKYMQHKSNIYRQIRSQGINGY